MLASSDDPDAARRGTARVIVLPDSDTPTDELPETVTAVEPLVFDTIVDVSRRPHLRKDCPRS